MKRYPECPTSDFICKDCKLFSTRDAPWAKNIDYLSGECLATNKTVNSRETRKCLIVSPEAFRTAKTNIEDRFERVRDECGRLEWVLSILENWKR